MTIVQKQIWYTKITLNLKINHDYQTTHMKMIVYLITAFDNIRNLNEKLNKLTILLYHIILRNFYFIFDNKLLYFFY